MSKRGGVHPAIIVLGVLALLTILIFAWPYLTGTDDKTKPNLDNVVKFGDAIGESRFNFVSYFIGGIPQFLIEWTNPVSASIVILALFFVLLFVFSDILSVFGTFSSNYVAWLVGSVLAIVAANLKVVMGIAVFGFSIAAGLGVFSVVVAVGVPFVLFLVMHFLFFKNFAGWVKGQKDIEQYRQGVRELKKGMQGIKDFGKAVGGRP